MTDNSFAARVKQFRLANGIKLFVLENHANPIVSLSGSLRAGEFFNPAGKDSLAAITAGMLNKGTERRSKLEIAEALESVGTRLGIGASTFTVSLSGQALSRDLPLVVSTLAEELRTPSFPEEELAKLKQRFIAGIKEDQDETRVRAFERMTQLVFTPDSPFHNPPAEQVINAIEQTSADEARAFHQARYGAGSIILAVVGDVEPEAVRDLIDQHLGDWQGATAPAIELPETDLRAEPHREFVAMKDKANCDVIIGHASRLRRLNPDYLAAVVANRALGQSTLSSRLGLKVRDELGLTYGINSGFSESGLGDGPFNIGVTVAPHNIDLAIDTTIEIVNDYLRDGITPEELADEQSSMTGGFKLGLATNGAIAGQLASAELFGLGVDYLDRFPDLVRALTKDEIDAAIRKYIHPEIATTVIAGTL